MQVWGAVSFKMGLDQFARAEPPTPARASEKSGTSPPTAATPSPHNFIAKVKSVFGWGIGDFLFLK